MPTSVHDGGDNHHVSFHGVNDSLGKTPGPALSVVWGDSAPSLEDDEESERWFARLRSGIPTPIQERRGRSIPQLPRVQARQEKGTDTSLGEPLTQILDHGWAVRAGCLAGFVFAITIFSQLCPCAFDLSGTFIIKAGKQCIGQQSAFTGRELQCFFFQDGLIHAL